MDKRQSEFVNGNADGGFAPHHEAARAEAAAILKRLLYKLAQN